MPAPTSKLTSVAEVAGTLKQVDQAFTAFQVARNTFANTLQGFLDRLDPQNIMLEALIKRDAMAVLCCPLAQDPVPGIQASALQSLAKLAGCDPLLSQAVVSCGILDSVVISMSHDSAPVQAGANMVMASVAGSTVDFARRVLEAGAMPGILRQLQTGTAPVKESAVRNLNSLIGSHADHAALIADDSVLSILVALLNAQDSPHSLCKAVVHTLATSAAYGADLAAAVIAAGALPPIALLVRGGSTPPDLRAAALNCLAHVASHSEALAAEVAATGLVGPTVAHMADKMVPQVRRAAAALLLQLARKTPALGVQVCGGGCPAALAKFLQLEKEGDGCATGLALAGALASYSPTTAKSVVDAGVGVEVVAALKRAESGAAAGTSGTTAAGGAYGRSSGMTARAAEGLSTGMGTRPGAAWAMEQIAQHGEEATMPLVAGGGLMAAVEAYMGSPEGSDLHLTAKAAVKAMVRSCATTGPLEPLIASSSPPPVLKHVLRRLEPLLGKDAKSRQAFVTSGALMRLQGLEGMLCHKGLRHTAAINALFPADVVVYYRQGR